MSDNHKFWKGVKSLFMRWYWRVGQIGALTSLILMALTYTTVLSDKIQWRFDNPYIAFMLTLAILWSVIMTVAYLYDVKGRFWVEQGEVVTHRNPYMTLHMTAKEIVSNLIYWIPIGKTLKIEPGTQIMEDWCQEAIRQDPRVKPICDMLIERFHAEKFIREKYPWYGV